MVVIDLGLSSPIYEGCEIQEVGGRQNLVTDPKDAANVVGRNVTAIVKATPRDERDEVVLTGPMAVWAYLVVFHVVVHAFTRVVYDDGRGTRVLIAAHG